MIDNKGKIFGNLQNRCRRCKKLFCCSNCRLAHEQKKHSERELKCPLCCSRKLQIKGDESHDFICHLVFHHLPLLCRLCGQSFKSNDDLTILQKCGWWKSENSRRLLQILENTLAPSTPKLEATKHLDSCNKRKTISRVKESSYFVTLNSPPVLIRNTSTPMISGPKTNFELRSSNSLSFLLKTPRNFSPSLEETESQPFFDNNELIKYATDTLLYSRSNSQSKSFIQSGSFPQISSEYYSCEQQDSNFGRRRLSSLTKVEERSETRVQDKKEIKEGKKRVRFSDQFSHTLEMAEYEEFFEARENLSEISQKLLDSEKDLSVNIAELTFDDSVNHDNEINVQKENKVSLEENNVSLETNKLCLESKFSSMYYNVDLKDNNGSNGNNLGSREDVKDKNVSSEEKNVYLRENLCLQENVYVEENICSIGTVCSKDTVCLKENVCFQENVCLKQNIVSFKENKVYSKENGHCSIENRNPFDELNNYSQQDGNSDDENKENELKNDRPTSSNFSSSETSSRTSQQSESSRVVMMLLVDNATRLSRSELMPLIDSGLKKLEETVSSVSTVYNSISSPSSQEEEYSATNLRRRSTSVNSYFTITSTECFTAQSGSLLSSDKENPSYENVQPSKSDGILSAVARVVRNALKKFPGTSLLQESSESVNKEPSSTLTESPSQLSSSSSSSSSPCPRESVTYLASKRPRDPTSPPEISSPPIQNEDRSPIAKRHRSWYKYKVRARQPIARMRKIQVTSPKGISSETQRFQQGSLSVGRLNTIIPLPSRAHQFTQTEN